MRIVRLRLSRRVRRQPLASSEEHAAKTCSAAELFNIAASARRAGGVLCRQGVWGETAYTFTDHETRFRMREIIEHNKIAEHPHGNTMDHTRPTREKLGLSTQK